MLFDPFFDVHDVVLDVFHVFMVKPKAKFSYLYFVFVLVMKAGLAGNLYNF